MYSKPLSYQYPYLYSIAQHKQVIVANMLSHTSLKIGFRLALTGNRGARWFHLVCRLMSINLTEQPDEFVRKLTKCSTPGKPLIENNYVFVLHIIMTACGDP